jgi:hypothetical protein
MKKLFFGLITVALLSNACSPAYVSTQPTYEEGFRPPRPSNNHVWVDGNWNYNRQSRSYKRSDGFWSMPYHTVDEDISQDIGETIVVGIIGIQGDGGRIIHF